MEFSKLRDAIDSSEEFKAEPYSGRYMYSKQCVGVVCDNPSDVIAFLIEEFAYIAENGGGHPHWADDLSKLVSSSRQDDMGRQRIIYFPDVEWEEDDNDVKT